jgi:hypothetical protein
MVVYQLLLTAALTNTKYKGRLTYSKKVIATMKYHWIDIQSKDYDGGLSTPTVKGLNKKI